MSMGILDLMRSKRIPERGVCRTCSNLVSLLFVGILDLCDSCTVDAIFYEKDTCLKFVSFFSKLFQHNKFERSNFKFEQ